MTPNYLVPQGSRSGKTLQTHFPFLCWQLILLLNVGHRGTGTLHHLHTTPCDHPGGSLDPARPFTDLAGGATGCHSIQKTGTIIFYFFRIATPGAPGSWASHIGYTPLIFRDVLANWVLQAQPAPKLDRARSDMTIRQNVQCAGISGK